MNHSSYHDINFDAKSRQNNIYLVADALLDYPNDVTVVVSGLSGILIGVPVADATNKNFAIVRKYGETCHGLAIEGQITGDYVIVDDFIASGSTVRHILERVKARDPNSNCLGILLYASRPWPSDIEGIPVKVVASL